MGNVPAITSPVTHGEGRACSSTGGDSAGPSKGWGHSNNGGVVGTGAVLRIPSLGSHSEDTGSSPPFRRFGASATPFGKLWGCRVLQYGGRVVKCLGCLGSVCSWGTSCVAGRSPRPGVPKRLGKLRFCWVPVEAGSLLPHSSGGSHSGTSPFLLLPYGCKSTVFYFPHIIMNE